MTSRHGNGGQGGSWDRGGTPPDLEVLVRQGRARLGRLLPGGNPRGIIVLALLTLAGLGAWTAYYTVPSDSVAKSRRDCISNCHWASMRRPSFPSNGS
jgi:membrane protease subunit HflK